jgi:hypothetical protein
MKWLMQRLAEPSTHAALAGAMQILNAFPATAPYANALTAVFALVGVGMAESSAPR